MKSNDKFLALCALLCEVSVPVSAFVLPAPDASTALSFRVRAARPIVRAIPPDSFIYMDNGEDPEEPDASSPASQRSGGAVESYLNDWGGLSSSSVMTGVTGGGSQSSAIELRRGGAWGAGGAVETDGDLDDAEIEVQSRDIWDMLSLVRIQGQQALRTWSFPTMSVKRVQVLMKTDGRPMNSNIRLWQGPANRPQHMDVYIEDGYARPFNAVIETPGDTNAVAIRNTGNIEFPLDACVEAEVDEEEDGVFVDDGVEVAASQAVLGAAIDRLAKSVRPLIVQGGSVYTKPFVGPVRNVQVMLSTIGRPMRARIELLSGPDNIKQTIDIYTEDGTERRFFIVMATPDDGSTVRIVNTATMEFPMFAWVEPF